MLALQSNPELLVAAGSIVLSDGTPANVAVYSFDNSTWSAVGQGSQIPGPVTACEIDNGNGSSIFAAGRYVSSGSTVVCVIDMVYFSSSDGSSPFLTFWNGVTWKTLGMLFRMTHASGRPCLGKLLGTTFQGATTVSQLSMVPLQDTHSSNTIIEPDRMLLISGSLASNSFGNVSAALFDGQNFFPYFVSTSPSGGAGFVSQLFHSLASFSFNQRRK